VNDSLILLDHDHRKEILAVFRAYSEKIVPVFAIIEVFQAKPFAYRIISHLSPPVGEAAG
jgi:hypothetical protein